MTSHTRTYQKRFWLIFFVLIISNTAFAIDVEYIVTIDNPSSGEANIKMIITNLSSESFSVQSIKNIPDEPKADVISIIAKDVNDNILNIDPYPSEDPFKWTVSTAGLSQCIIDYIIKPKAYSAPWHPPNTEYYYCYISQDFVLAPPWAVFLIPVNGSWIKPDILKISLNVPPNWKKIVPWPFRDGYYYPLEIISPNWFDTFPTTAFVLGNLDSYLKKIGNTDINVAFYGSWPDNFVQDSVNNVRDIYSYYTSVWGHSSDYPYNVVFFPMSINGNLVNGNESALDKLVEYNFNDPPNWKDFSADICESRWLTLDWGYLGGPFGWGWDKFGFSTLYGHKSAAKLRLESLGWLNGNYSGDRDIYLQRIQDGTDLPLASTEAETDRELLWSKGSLVTLLLAKEIYSRTDGRLRFDDLNKSLFEKYSGNIINEEELLSEINSLTGLDFQQFFNDYIYGTELLPLDWMFEDDDGDEISNISEIFWDTNPNSSDTDSDGDSDFDEIHLGSDPLDKNSVNLNRVDFDDDGDIDGIDHGLFISNYDRMDCNGDCYGDFEPDGDVDQDDLAVFSASFGKIVCPGDLELVVADSLDLVGITPGGLAFDGSNLWCVVNNERKIHKLDTAGNIVATIDAPGPSPTGLTFDGTHLWNTDDQSLKIYKLDTSGTILEFFDVPGYQTTPGPDSTGLTFDGIHLWNADFSLGGRIHQVDTSGNVINTFQSPGSGPTGLAFDGEYLWLADVYEDRIYKMNTSGAVTHSFISPIGVPIGLAHDGSFLRLTSSGGTNIYKIGISCR